MGAIFTDFIESNAKHLGFSQIPHELVKYSHSISHTSSQFEVLFSLYSKTLGQQKTRCESSVRGIAKDTGLSKTTVHSALKSFEQRGLIHYLVKSRIVGVPSLIDIPWLSPYLPAEQKKLRDSRKIARLQLVPNCGPQSITSENERELMKLDESSETVGASKNVDVTGSTPVPSNGTIGEYLTDPIVPISRTSLRIVINNNSYLDTTYHTPTSKPMDIAMAKTRPMSTPVSMPLANAEPRQERQTDSLAVTRELLKRRWQKLRASGEGKIIEKEKEFFGSLKKSYPEDITLAVLTFEHFETQGVDFLGRKCTRPVENLARIWHLVRMRAQRELGEKVEAVQGMTLMDYQAKVEQKQREQEQFKATRQEGQAAGHTGWDQALQQFKQTFADEFSQRDAIKRYASPWAGIHTALYSAAKNWWEEQSLRD